MGSSTRNNLFFILTTVAYGFQLPAAAPGPLK